MDEFETAEAAEAAKVLRKRLQTICSQKNHSNQWRLWVKRPLLLPAHLVWMYLFFIRHRGRQEFVTDIVVNRLQGATPSRNADGVPVGPPTGVVPGKSEWEYVLSYCGCTLTHRLTGEVIDMDFDDDVGESICLSDAFDYLASLKNPSFVEERVKNLDSQRTTLYLSSQELAETGLAESDGRYLAIGICPEDQRIATLLPEIEARWADPTVRRSFAAAVGDWSLLQSLVEKADVSVVRELQEDAAKTRGNALANNIALGLDDAASLYALKNLDDGRIDDCLRNAIHTVPEITRAAVTIIKESDDGKWCDDIWSLLNRIDLSNQPYDAELWCQCAEYLLSHGVRVNEIKKSVSMVGPSCLGKVAILSLRFFPSLAVEAFRRALRSEEWCDRVTAAAALAILDQPWSREELSKVLDESDDLEMTADCRSALTHTHSVEAHHKVADWDICNSVVEVAAADDGDTLLRLREADESISHEMQKLHDTVMPLRTVVIEPKGRRWHGG